MYQYKVGKTLPHQEAYHYIETKLEKLVMSQSSYTDCLCLTNKF